MRNEAYPVCKHCGITRLADSAPCHSCGLTFDDTVVRIDPMIRSLTVCPCCQWQVPTGTVRCPICVSLIVSDRAGASRSYRPLVLESRTTWHATFVFHTNDPKVHEAIKSYAGRVRNGAPNTMIRFAMPVPGGQSPREVAIQTAEMVTHLSNMPGLDVALFCWERPDLGHLSYNLKFGFD